MIPFFNSTDEIKPFLGVAVSDISEESLESYAINSMSDIAIITGNAFILDLWDKFKDNSLSEDEEEIVGKIKKPIANMTFCRHSMQGVLFISDSGYSIEEGANSKRAFQWMLRDFRYECLKAYSEGMNVLWEYVLDNIESFSAIGESEQYIYLKKRPINKLNQWASAGRRIADWRTHFSLCAEMSIVWEDMSSIISAALLEEVDSYLLEGGTNEDIDALLIYIRRYVAHHTIERSAITMPISIEANGLVLKEVASTTNNNEVVKQVTDKNLIQKQAEVESIKAKKRLLEFLNANATADKYVGFYNEYILNYEPIITNTIENKIIIM